MNKDPNQITSVASADAAQEPQKKQWLWTILFVALAAVSILAVVLQSREFSFTQFTSFLKSASIPWLIVSFCSMLCFILFEGLAVLHLCRAFGYRRSLKNGLLYSASDIYFSAITPSATGGQPMSAYFMVKDGIPGMLVTVALVANLYMYSLAIIAIGLICFLCYPSIFLNFHPFSKFLIVIGTVGQLGLSGLFYLLLKHETLLHRICKGCLRFLCKIRLLKKEEEKQAKLTEYMEKYRQYSKLLSDHKKDLLVVFLYNFIQRASQIAVTMFTYLATGGDLAQAGRLWALQGFVVLGSNMVPIPGAMGVSDYLMLDGFRSVMSESAAVNLELLSRSFSFYICIILCGVTTICGFRAVKKRS